MGLFMFTVPLYRADGEPRTLREIEYDVLDNIMSVCPDRTSAARLLGIGRSTLYRKIDERNRFGTIIPTRQSQAV